MRKDSQIAPMMPLFELLCQPKKLAQSEWLQREMPLLKMPDDSLQKKNTSLIVMILCRFFLVCKNGKQNIKQDQ